MTFVCIWNTVYKNYNYHEVGIKLIKINIDFDLLIINNTILV